MTLGETLALILSIVGFIVTLVALSILLSGGQF